MKYIEDVNSEKDLGAIFEVIFGCHLKLSKQISASVNKANIWRNAIKDIWE